MKTFVISVTVLFLTISLQAQSAVDRIFEKYAGQEGYTTVVINSFMFKFLSNIESDDPEYESFKKATEGIESIRILTQDGKESANFGKELLQSLPKNEYEELMVVKEAGEDVQFLVREKDGQIVEFLLIVSSEHDEDALIAISGIIDLESISSLTSGMDLPGMDNLDDLE